MDDSKPWYQSKTIQSAIVTALAGLWNSVAVSHGMPPIPEWIYGLLGAVGVYSRVTASTKITF